MVFLPRGITGAVASLVGRVTTQKTP
jgi:hypothetical protein